MTDENPPIPERVRSFFESTPVPEDPIDELIDDLQYQALLDIDPSALRVSELRLRLAGPSIRDGFYDSDVQNALAGPLGKELSAAAGSKHPQQTRLGLVGISPGSVILHYRPSEPVLPAPGGEEGVEIVPADMAVRKVLSLHRMFEDQANPAEIAAFAGTSKALLKGAKGVVEALERFDLELSATWWSPSGEKVRSLLTKRGRDHAVGVFKHQELAERISISGRVSALDEDGIVTVRTPTQKYAVRVEEDAVADFELGETVHLYVRAVAHVDQVGLKGRSDYTLMWRERDPDELDLSDPPTF